MNPRIMVRIHAPEPMTDRWPRLRRFIEALSAPAPGAGFGPTALGARSYPVQYTDRNMGLLPRIACLASPGHVLSVPLFPFSDVPGPLAELEDEETDIVRVYRLWGSDVDQGPKTTAAFVRFVGRASTDHRRDCEWFEGAVGSSLGFKLSWLLPPLGAAGGDRIVVDRYARYLTLLRLNDTGVRAGIAIELVGDERRVFDDGNAPHERPRALDLLQRCAVSVERSTEGEPPSLTSALESGSGG